MAATPPHLDASGALPDRPEPGPDPSAETHPDPSAETHPGPRAETHPGPRAEAHPETSAEAHPEPGPDPSAEAHPGPRAEAHPETSGDSRDFRADAGAEEPPAHRGIDDTWDEWAATPPPPAFAARPGPQWAEPTPIDGAAAAIEGLPTWAQARATAAPPGAWEAAGRAVWPWGLRGLAETLEVVGLALLMFLVVRAGTGNFIVDGRSMFPTFDSGEMLIVNKLAYRTFDISWLPFTDEEAWSPLGPGEPAAGDVVVFRFPNDPGRDFIKRVIAVPGQTVEVRDGVLLVDGRPVDEPYLIEPPLYQFGPETVGPHELFVLGDNRNNSYDSHQWGMLEDTYLIGRAELRYWPLSAFGRIGSEEPQPLTGGVVEAGGPSSP